ncbi:MAG: molybdate ABC transporter permease subunit [Opitutales bacterium]|nr:molybdate ABC transporter permease subunit [Opitutales bacterium]
MGNIPEIIFSTLIWALLSTTIVMAASIPLAYLLARKDFLGKRVVATLISLPLVLPPTAVGYLLLQLLSDNGPLGASMIGLDLNILFNWKGIVLACSVMSLPLVVRTMRVSFEEVNPRLEVMARTLGRSPLNTFFTVTIPLAARGILAAMILGFTRAIGEFGASMMIAGNIPGRTQTLSSAIYSAQQSGQMDKGLILLLIAIAIGFIAVFFTEYLSNPKSSKREKGVLNG